MGNPHIYRREAQALLASTAFDVTLISRHYLKGHNIHVDDCFAGRGPQDVYTEYFDELHKMVSAFPGHVAAHFDRILYQGLLRGAPLDLFRCERHIRRALECIAANAQALELNSCFLDQDHRWHDALITMLRWYRSAGGTRIVVSSDAHDVETIGHNFDLAREVLIGAEFSDLSNPHPLIASSQESS